jgi:Holliday junction resolvase
MTQRESKLSRNIMAALRDMGVFCFKVHGGPTMMAGLPDIVCCVDGMFVCFETKVPEQRANVSLIQQRVHGKIRKAGGKVYVICSPREAVSIVNQLRQEKLNRTLRRRVVDVELPD